MTSIETSYKTSFSW